MSEPPLPSDLRGRVLWAPRAWVQGRWQESVQLAIDATGHWSELSCGVAPASEAIKLTGPVLPGLVNAHSHAFQRAFAGMAETRSNAMDDFWSWRDRMYGVALRITPAELRAVTRQLCTELLQGGYTQLCEFHYLHHQPDGKAYEDELEMAWAIADGAADAGIGLTLLPVLYERAGFTQPQLRDDQRRFATDAQRVLRMRDGIRAAASTSARPNLNAGVAIHSLRAARPESIRALIKGCEGDDGPIHIHVAEQTAEVDECLTATGRRPIEWLAHERLLDARWQLVHATHATPAEIDAVAASGAGVVLCPSTEANLGDGIPDLPRWLASSAPLTLGSDSHVGRDWPGELRLLEYGQRLTLRRRNVCAAPELGEPSTAGRLFNRVSAGGAAAGLARWGVEVGARADLLVVASAVMPGRIDPGDQLDDTVFAAAGQSFSYAMVRGRWRLDLEPV